MDSVTIYSLLNLSKSSLEKDRVKLVESWIENTEYEIEIKIESIKNEIEKKSQMIIQKIDKMMSSTNLLNIYDFECLCTFFKHSHHAIQQENIGCFYKYEPKCISIIEAIINDDVDDFLYYYDRHKKENPIDILIECEQKGETALHYVANAGSLKIIKTIINDKIEDVNVKNSVGRSPLFSACQGSHTEVIKYLVRNGADIYMKDYFGISPLEISIPLRDKSEIVKFFLSEIDPNRRSEVIQSAFFHACLLGDIEAAEFFINEGAIIHGNDEYESALIHSVWNQINFVDFILKKGVDVNARDHNGRNVLMLVSRRFDEDFTFMFNYLIQVGIDVNAIDNDGRSALIHASQNRCKNTLKNLIRHGANLEFKDKNGSTALIEASKTRNYKIVKFLVNAGADVNVGDNNGCTPLMFASKKGNLDMIRILMNNGADFKAIDYNGHTALMHLHEFKCSTIVKALTQYRKENKIKRKKCLEFIKNKKNMIRPKKSY